MARPVHITSLAHFRDQLKFDNGFVVAEFSNSADVSFSQMAETMIATAADPRTTRYLRVKADQLADVLSAYEITQLPTIAFFHKGRLLKKTTANGIPGIMKELGGGGGQQASQSSRASVSVANWLGAELPRGYKDVTDQIEHKRVELLNVDSEKGGVRVLFSAAAPSALSGGKSKDADWVESDTDEQLLLFMPFQSVLKLHTLQITSIPPTGDDYDEDETPMRPQTIRLYTNRPHNIGFDQAESTTSTQDIVISESDWNDKGTANIPLRFVKFQNINSLIIFVVDGQGSSSEKVRVDRLRLIGESGEKREMGPLEKVGEES